MASSSFSIYSNNVLTCDSHGNGSVNFSANDFQIPNGILPGSPATLQDLFLLIGAGNILINYYIQATGSVSSHDCWSTYTLYVQGTLGDGSFTNEIGVWATSNNPDSGSSVNSGWEILLTGADSIISSLSTHENCNGSGCGCAFESKGGWSNVSISLRTDVTVNLLDFCIGTGPNFVYNQNDLCYNYISDYITNTSLGPTQPITSAMQNYCTQKFPNSGLDIFNLPATIDSRDYKLCACNMPDQLYQQFEQSIKGQFPNLNLGSIRPNCLLPACINSPFKNNELDNCPIPQCLEIVNINGSTISGPTTINQNQNCSKYGIMGGTTPPSPPPSPTPSQPTLNNFWSKYKWWIFAFLFIIIALLILVIILPGEHKNKMKIRM